MEGGKVGSDVLEMRFKEQVELHFQNCIPKDSQRFGKPMSRFGVGQVGLCVPGRRRAFLQLAWKYVEVRIRAPVWDAAGGWCYLGCGSHSLGVDGGKHMKVVIRRRGARRSRSSCGAP